MFRSTLFAFLFYLSTAVLCIIWLPLIVLPRKYFAYLAEFWVRFMLVIVEGVLGIRCNVQGREHIPDGPCIFASKHQSMWDVLIFKALIRDCAYVLKRDLFYIPLWGWYLWRTGMIGIDRSGGAKALRGMIERSKEIIDEGRSIVIFPQGTRTAPGDTRPYQPGVAALYKNVDVPVVPVALNSGSFWPRRKFIKTPGTVTLQFLPPISQGMDRKTFAQELENRIEAATNVLETNNFKDGDSHLLEDAKNSTVENHVENDTDTPFKSNKVQKQPVTG